MLPADPVLPEVRPMLGQFFELRPGIPPGPRWAGARALLLGAGAVVEELPLVVVLEPAAFAIAAPPPTSAPVTASVVKMGFNVLIRFSPPLSRLRTPCTPSV